MADGTLPGRARRQADTSSSYLCVFVWPTATAQRPAIPWSGLVPPTSCSHPSSSCPTNVNVRRQHQRNPSSHPSASERLLHGAGTSLIIALHLFECGERVQQQPCRMHTVLPRCVRDNIPTSSSCLSCLPILDATLPLSSHLPSQLTGLCFGSTFRRSH